MNKLILTILIATISSSSFAEISFSMKNITAPKFISNDWDGDGIINSEDDDDDNDGIPDSEDSTPLSRSGQKSVTPKEPECFSQYITGSYAGERYDTYMYYSNSTFYFQWKHEITYTDTSSQEPVDQDTAIVYNGYKYWEDLDDIVYQFQQTSISFENGQLIQTVKTTNYYGVCRIEI